MQNIKNIIFNTTRQWNCGDEFILFGVREILKTAGVKHNAIIYNRNPDIRPYNGLIKGLRDFAAVPAMAGDSLFNKKESWLRVGFYDNSIKFNSDMSFADLAIFPGTLEWSTERCANFYEHIYKNNLPVLLLGIGSAHAGFGFMEEVLENAALITLRDRNLLKEEMAKKYKAVYLPCPALLSVPLGAERNVTELKKIALIFVTGIKEGVVAQAVSDETHQYCIGLYNKLLDKYRGKYDFSIVCHYIDELAPARRVFGVRGVRILYSFSAEEYLDIYKEFDFVISPRVHGCGCATSNGVPSVAISHDERGGTSEGFKAVIIKTGAAFEDISAVLDNASKDITAIHKDLLKHKKAVMTRYIELVSSALQKPRPVYKNKTVPYEAPLFKINTLEDIKHAIVFKDSLAPLKNIYYRAGIVLYNIGINLSFGCLRSNLKAKKMDFKVRRK
jgi:hypothetical protein